MSSNSETSKKIQQWILYNLFVVHPDDNRRFKPLVIAFSGLILSYCIRNFFYDFSDFTFREHSLHQSADNFHFSDPSFRCVEMVKEV